MRTRPNATTVGRLWVDEGGQVWKQIAFADCPTASFVRTEEPDERPTTTTVTSYFAERLTLLVPEESS